MTVLPDPQATAIARFLRQIGIDVHLCALPEPTFLPGIRIDGGRLLVDPERLTYPGDLLHEAGHVALRRPGDRDGMRDDVGADPGEEIGAIAWSYAAAVHLGLDPSVVFHADGYRGSSAALLENFAAKRFVGVPLLQWMGLCMDDDIAAAAGVKPYPHMLRWLRD